MRHVLHHADACMACMHRYEFRLRGTLDDGTPDGSEFLYKNADGAADTFFAFFVPKPAVADLQAGTSPLNRRLWVEHDSMNQLVIPADSYRTEETAG